MKHFLNLSSFLFIFSLILMLSCRNAPTTESSIGSDSTQAAADTIIEEKEAQVLTAFDEYLSLFPGATIPLVILNPDSLNSYKPDNDATLFSSFRGTTFFNSQWAACKRIPSLENTVAVLTVENGLAYNKVLLLETYTPEGIPIDKKYLDFGFEENGDPAGSVEFKKDFSFHVFTKSEGVEYDENNNEIPGSQQVHKHSMQGKIQNDGKIQLSQKIWINK